MRVIGLTDLRRYLLAKSIDQPRRLTMTHCGDEEFTFGIFFSDQSPVIGSNYCEIDRYIGKAF